jgi:hypothetical protein
MAGAASFLTSEFAKRILFRTSYRGGNKVCGVAERLVRSRSKSSGAREGEFEQS